MSFSRIQHNVSGKSRAISNSFDPKSKVLPLSWSSILSKGKGHRSLPYFVYASSDALASRYGCSKCDKIIIVFRPNKKVSVLRVTDPT